MTGGDVAAFRREELLALPAVVSLTTAGRAFGIGRNTAHELARRGEFPVPVLKLGSQYRVVTSALLAVLGIDATDSEAGPASPATATDTATGGPRFDGTTLRAI